MSTWNFASEYPSPPQSPALKHLKALDQAADFDLEREYDLSFGTSPLSTPTTHA